MSECNKTHLVKNGDKSHVVPCYYIAGICVVDPIHQGTLEMFLRSTYPYYHSASYESSKQMHNEMVPNDIKFANTNA